MGWRPLPCDLPDMGDLLRLNWEPAHQKRYFSKLTFLMPPRPSHGSGIWRGGEGLRHTCTTWTFFCAVGGGGEEGLVLAFLLADGKQGLSALASLRGRPTEGGQWQFLIAKSKCEIKSRLFF